jgi:hypothetical protein
MRRRMAGMLAAVVEKAKEAKERKAKATKPKSSSSMHH